MDKCRYGSTCILLCKEFSTSNTKRGYFAFYTTNVNYCIGAMIQNTHVMPEKHLKITLLEIGNKKRVLTHDAPPRQPNPD